jgi:hypothetical protein
VSQRDEARDSYYRLCWLHSPVCLEWRQEARGEASPFRSLVGLASKTSHALARMLGVRLC